MKRFFCVLLVWVMVGASASAQKRGSVWCFGDSALVDFSDTANIVTGTSSVKSRGSCVSISDSAGHLILYAYTRAGVNHNTTLLKNNQFFLLYFPLSCSDCVDIIYFYYL